jgi:hypothetical protein
MMHTQIKVRDELVFRVGRPPAEFVLGFPADHLTVRELICSRVVQEVAMFNERPTEYFQGLIQPTGAELTLNGYRVPRQHQIDANEQLQRALAAFERNGFMLLVDDRQVEGLDDLVVLQPTTVVTFLKLIPLVGG